MICKWNQKFEVTLYNMLIKDITVAFERKLTKNTVTIKVTKNPLEKC